MGNSKIGNRYWPWESRQRSRYRQGNVKNTTQYKYDLHTFVPVGFAGVVSIVIPPEIKNYIVTKLTVSKLNKKK